MKAAFGPSTSSPDPRQRPASRSWGFGPVVRTCVHRTGELLRWSSALCLVGLVVCAWSMNRPERTVDGGIGSGGRISHGGASGGRSPGRHTTRLEVLRVDPKQIRQDIVVNPKYTIDEDGEFGHNDDDDDDDDHYHHNHQADGRILKVVLLTYFRGGSTFLGELFNQNPRTFYWFEPLAAQMVAYKREHYGKDYTIDNDSNAIRRPDDFVESLRRTTSNILNCSIRDVDVEVKKHYFAVSWRKSVKFAKYRSCLLHYRIRHVKEVTVTAVERCQRHLAKECRTSDVRVIKAIRFFVDEVIPVVDHDPDTKLVYYVRDPRGILLSRWSLSKLPLAAIPFSKIDQMAAYLCAKMRRDLKTALQYREDHPDQLLIMQYETLASSPVSTLQELYRFVGVGVPSDLIDWIQYATQAAKSDGMVGSIRKNGSEVSTRWQHELSPEHLRIIERHCDDVIDLIYSIPFGYR